MPSTGTRRIVAAAITLVAHLGLLVLLLELGGAGVNRPSAAPPIITVADLPPVPPVPPPPPRKRRNGQRKSPVRAVVTAPRPAPPAPAPLAPPPPIVPLSLPVAMPAGPGGSGTGGEGNGTGAGGGGAGGNGGGDGTPPVRVGGRIRDSDYPASLSEAGVSGTVSVRYRVGTDGRASGCTITHSSGSATLDAHTCALIEKRFRFRPSRDADGRPVPSIIVENHSWIIPAAPPAGATEGAPHSQ